MAKRFHEPRTHSLALELDRLAALEAEVLAVERANPQPFPAPGSVCVCGEASSTTPYGGPASQCRRAHTGKYAGTVIPCACWCHVVKIAR